ncbi:MAG: hypothetical protein IKN76_04395 [Oscillospiraceae bacterium]|nr:hypothetical protein [Oscillospiraceae bacterium]
MHSLSNSVKKHRNFVDYLTKRKQTRRDVRSAASPEEKRIESQGGGFDPVKEKRSSAVKQTGTKPGEADPVRKGGAAE